MKDGDLNGGANAPVTDGREPRRSCIRKVGMSRALDARITAWADEMGWTIAEAYRKLISGGAKSAGLMGAPATAAVALMLC